jgi:hypothetical protein
MIEQEQLMQSANCDTRTLEIDLMPPADDSDGSTTSLVSNARQLVNDALDWLDRYWDDPELRSGFWRSGW